jgi:hypothetical protein
MFYGWELTDKNNNVVYFPNGEDNTLKITVIESSELSGEKDKKNGFIRIKISNKTGQNLDTAIIVKNSRFTIKVRFEDDEGDTAFATKDISVYNRLPEAKFQYYQGNKRVEKPYITLLQKKDFGEHTQINKYKVHSGFGNPKCLEDFYINGLSSLDADGNASDQIKKIEYDIDNNGVFEIGLLGINQQKQFNSSDGFDGFEDRFVVNASFRLVSKEERKTKGDSKTYYLSSTWNNTNSPVIDSVPYLYRLNPNRTHKIAIRITDNEESSIIDTIKTAILIPPTIDFAEIGIGNLCNNQNTNKYNGSVLVLPKNSQDGVIYFKASATDEDGESTEDKKNVVYHWGFKEKNSSLSAVSLTNPNWKHSLSGADTERTYQELRTTTGLMSGTVYEVILKVTDNDNSITELENGSGITMMKVGEIRLE